MDEKMIQFANEKLLMNVTNSFDINMTEEKDLRVDSWGDTLNITTPPLCSSVNRQLVTFALAYLPALGSKELFRKIEEDVRKLLRPILQPEGGGRNGYPEFYYPSVGPEFSVEKMVKQIRVSFQRISPETVVPFIIMPAGIPQLVRDQLISEGKRWEGKPIFNALQRGLSSAKIERVAEQILTGKTDPVPEISMGPKMGPVAPSRLEGVRVRNDMGPFADTPRVYWFSNQSNAQIHGVFNLTAEQKESLEERLIRNYRGEVMDDQLKEAMLEDVKTWLTSWEGKGNRPSFRPPETFLPTGNLSLSKVVVAGTPRSLDRPFVDALRDIYERPVEIPFSPKAVVTESSWGRMAGVVSEPAEIRYSEADTKVTLEAFRELNVDERAACTSWLISLQNMKLSDDDKGVAQFVAGLYNDDPGAFAVLLESILVEADRRGLKLDLMTAPEWIEVIREIDPPGIPLRGEKLGDIRARVYRRLAKILVEREGKQVVEKDRKLIGKFLDLGQMNDGFEDLLYEEDEEVYQKFKAFRLMAAVLGSPAKDEEEPKESSPKPKTRKFDWD
jgi:hypothetical protein